MIRHTNRMSWYMGISFEYTAFAAARYASIDVRGCWV
jgi:hypothetical protein